MYNTILTALFLWILFVILMDGKLQPHEVDTFVYLQGTCGTFTQQHQKHDVASFTLVSSLPTSLLLVGEMVFIHPPGSLIRLAHAGLLPVGNCIIVIKAGDRIPHGTMCYSHSRIVDDSYLGLVLYVHAGIAFIELFMQTRDDVCSVVTSEKQEQQ